MLAAQQGGGGVTPRPPPAAPRAAPSAAAGPGPWHGMRMPWVPVRGAHAGARASGHGPGPLGGASGRGPAEGGGVPEAPGTMPRDAAYPAQVYHADAYASPLTRGRHAYHYYFLWSLTHTSYFTPARTKQLVQTLMDKRLQVSHLNQLS